MGSEIAADRTEFPPRLRGLVYFFYATLGMVLYQDGLTSALRLLRGAPPLEPGQSEISNTIGQLILLCGLVIFLWGYRNMLRRAVRPLLPIIALIALCFVSALWSDFPTVTIRKSGTLTICILFGVYCYFQFGLIKTIEMIANTTAVLAVLSLAAYFLLPSVGRETALNYHNAIRGVYSQKNTIGMAMLIAANYWLFAFFSGRRLSLRAGIGAIATLTCLVLSSSATSLLSFCVILCLHFLDYARRSWRLRFVTIYVVAVVFFVLGVAVLVAPAELLGLFGRDLTLTGRVPLWLASIQAWLAKPILGYGFGAFWDHNSTLVQSIWRDLAWEAPNAHDGYLDVLLQLGVVGFGVCLWVWGRIILGALRAAKRRMPGISWLMGFILISIIVNLDEGGQPEAGEFALFLPVILLALANVSRQLPRRGRGVSRT